MADKDDLSRTRWARIRREIAAVMDDERPDRYVVQDTTDADVAHEGDTDETATWLDDVAGAVADLIPDAEVKQRFAREIVGDIEAGALRRGNKHLRDLRHAEQGTLPLGFSYPVSIHHRVVKKGERPKVRVERVQIAALTTRDLLLFDTEERRRASVEFTTRHETCEAARWLADQLDEFGCKTVGQWWDRTSDHDYAPASH